MSSNSNLAFLFFMLMLEDMASKFRKRNMNNERNLNSPVLNEKNNYEKAHHLIPYLFIY